MGPSLPNPPRSKSIRDVKRKVIGLGRMSRIPEYGPMGAKAIQEQIHKGFE